MSCCAKLHYVVVQEDDGDWAPPRIADAYLQKYACAPCDSQPQQELMSTVQHDPAQHHWQSKSANGDHPMHQQDVAEIEALQGQEDPVSPAKATEQEQHDGAALRRAASLEARQLYGLMHESAFDQPGQTSDLYCTDTKAHFEATDEQHAYEVGEEEREVSEWQDELALVDSEARSAPPSVCNSAHYAAQHESYSPAVADQPDNMAEQQPKMAQQEALHACQPDGARSASQALLATQPQFPAGGTPRQPSVVVKHSAGLAKHASGHVEHGDVQIGRKRKRTADAVAANRRQRLAAKATNVVTGASRYVGWCLVAWLVCEFLRGQAV